jgi:hypothetical protein
VLAPELEQSFTADAEPEPTESAGRGFITEAEYNAQVRAMQARGGDIAFDFSNRQ